MSKRVFPDDDKVTRMTILVPKSLKAKFKIYVIERNLESMSIVLRDHIEEMLLEDERRKAKEAIV